MTLIWGDCNLERVEWKQDDRMVGITHDLRRIFSGFRSQCISRASLSTVRASRSCAMKTLTS